MSKVFLYGSGDNAVTYYRSFLPAKNLGLTCNDKTDDSYDVYWFGRKVSDEVFSYVKQLVSSGKKIIWDLDDDVFNIPKSNPSYPHFINCHDKILGCLSLSTFITCSTSPLQRRLNGMGFNNVFVLPNLIDLDHWKLTEKVPNEKLRILWAGGFNHKDDLDLLVPIVKGLLDLDVEFWFFGDIPNELATWQQIKYTFLAQQNPIHPKIKYVPGVSLRNYIPTLLSINPDISLLPLCDNVFNQSKSNLKFMETGLCSACCIANSSVYDEAIVRPLSAWVEIIKTIIDGEHHAGLGYAHRCNVINNWTWQHSHLVQRWKDFVRLL